MPYKRWKPIKEEEKPEPSLIERLGGPAGALATGVRGITGILAPGGAPGAAIGGGGEAFAQLIESLGGLGLNQTIPQRLARIGTEAAVGLVPFSKVIKSGQALKNFGRGALFAGAGDAARQMAEKGEFLNPTEIDYARTGTASGIGGAAGMAGQKLIDVLAPGSKIASKALPKETTAPAIVEQTARPGGKVLVPRGKYDPKKGTYGSYDTTDTGPNWTVQDSGARSYGGTRTLSRSDEAAVKSSGKPPKTSLADEFFRQLAKESGQSVSATPKASSVARMPWEDITGWADQPQSGRGVPIRTEPGITPREQKGLDTAARRVSQAERDTIRLRKEEERLAEAALAKQRAENAKARGLIPEDSVVERTSRINEEGAQETVSRRWVEEAAEEGDDLSPEELFAEPSPRGAAYTKARRGGLSHDEAWKRARKFDSEPPDFPTVESKGPESTPPPPPQTGLARIFRPQTEPPGKPSTPVVEPDYIDADFTVEPSVPSGPKQLPGSPLRRLLGPKSEPPPAPLKPSDDELKALNDAVDVAGANYRAAKLRGDDPKVVRALGEALQNAARAAGLPTGKAAKAAAKPKAVEPPPPTPPATQAELDAAPDWVREQLAEADRLANTVIPAGPPPVELPPLIPETAPAPAAAIPLSPQAVQRIAELRAALEPTAPTNSAWNRAVHELIDRIERGGDVPTPTPQPPLPPGAGKVEVKPSGETASQEDLQAEIRRLFSAQQQTQPGSKARKATTKAVKSAQNRLDLATSPRAQASSDLDKLKAVLGMTAAGSAEEADAMAQVAAAQRRLDSLPPEPTAPAPTILSKGEGKPILRKPKTPLDLKGETGLASDMMPLTLLSTILGGLTGAAINPDDPMTSALIGAGLGFAGPQLPIAFSKANMPKLGESFSEAFQSGADKLGEFATETIEKVPNAMRANLLWSGNLPINTALAPYGSAAIGGLEQALQGNPAGMAVLRNLNPKRFAEGIWANRDEAAEALAKGEMGRLDADTLLNPTRSVADLYMAGPAQAMASGDITGRNAMRAGGFTEEMARKYAITGEPDATKGIGGFIGHTLANIGRGPAETSGSKIGKAAMGIVQPFRRTLANVVAEGVERLPGVGPAVHLANKGLAGIDWNEVAAQQKMSIPMSGLAALLGAEVDPETAKLMRLRAILSNMSGVYSLPVSAAYTLGLGLNEGQSAKQLVRAGMSEALPLPSTAPFEDALKAGIDLMNGEAPEIPRQMYPGIVRDIRQLTGADQVVPRQPRRIPRMRLNRER